MDGVKVVRVHSAARAFRVAPRRSRSSRGTWTSHCGHVTSTCVVLCARARASRPRPLARASPRAGSAPVVRVGPRASSRGRHLAASLAPRPSPSPRSPSPPSRTRAAPPSPSPTRWTPPTPTPPPPVPRCSRSSTASATTPPSPTSAWRSARARHRRRRRHARGGRFLLGRDQPRPRVHPRRARGTPKTARKPALQAACEIVAHGAQSRVPEETPSRKHPPRRVSSRTIRVPSRTPPSRTPPRRSRAPSSPPRRRRCCAKTVSR